MKKTTIASATLVASMLLPVTAQAGSYYNCSTVKGKGCVSVKKVKNTSKYTKTKYPVVLAHGLAGWTKIFKTLDYFHGIPQELIKGGADVYTTNISSAHGSEHRGEQLLKQVKTIAAVSGKKKVNLIGHSHGGNDIRYVAAVAPRYVASVTAVASPQQGSKMADWIVNRVHKDASKLGLKEGQLKFGIKMAKKFLEFVGRFEKIGSNVNFKKIQKQDSWDAVTSLTSKHMKKFNRKFPAAMPKTYCGKATKVRVHGIPYYSFSGVAKKTNKLDASDALLSLTARSFGKDPNDGLVSACSSHLGKVIRDNYRMNHLDSVNHLLGLTAAKQTKPITIYRTQVNRIKKKEGL